jgi:ParB family chromosome partitioning protein
MSERRLGRGLESLLGNLKEEAPSVPAPLGGIQRVPISKIRANPQQPRTAFAERELAELAESVKAVGILQPLVVRAEGGGYQLIAGERRLRAAKLAGLETVPIIERAATDDELLTLALIENLQREDLNPIEEAEAYVRLIDEFGHTQEELAKLLGRSRSHVGNYVRLAHAGGKVRLYLEQGKLSAGHARALLGAEHADRLADEIVARDLTVRQAEALAQKPPRNRKAAQKSADTLALERDLADRWGLPVRIKENPGGGGTLTLAYDTLDQLESFLERAR